MISAAGKVFVLDPDANSIDIAKTNLKEEIPNLQTFITAK